MTHTPDERARQRFKPTVKLTRRRQLWNLLRNLWLLRRELVERYLLRRKPQHEPGVPVVCIVCRHELTKPCKRGRRTHVIEWPEQLGAVGEFVPGQLVEVHRQKPRGGQYDKYDRMRPLLRNGKPVFRR